MATATAVKKSPLRDDLGVVTADIAMPWLNFMCYGEPGAGKTRLLGTAADVPQMSPLLFLDVEGGITTLRKRKDIDVLQVRTMDEVEKVINKLLDDKTGYYKTVALDSVTLLQQMDMRAVMDIAYNRNPDRVDKMVPSQREWGINGERMRIIIRYFKDLPMHFICTALMATEKDSDGKLLGYHPMLPGRQRGEIPGYFDIVGLLTAREERNGEVIIRGLQTAKTRKVVAKDRFDELPGLLDNPTFQDIWNIIKG